MWPRDGHLPGGFGLKTPIILLTQHLIINLESPEALISRELATEVVAELPRVRWERVSACILSQVHEKPFTLPLHHVNDSKVRE